MITTRITLPKKFQARAQFVATFLDSNVDQVYGALIIAGVGNTGVEDLPAIVKPILAANFPKKSKGASSAKSK